MAAVGLSSLCASTLDAAQNPDAAAPVDPMPEPEQFDELDLDNLLSLEVSVASLKATSLRESPGIVSVITRSDIVDWGARDLIDVLRMVPGFYFGVDVLGVVGLGTRGLWAIEGKILLMLDGFAMNELDYQSINFGHRFPVEMIERIEIIRGPGSAIYGGNAELGVINVVTRSAEDLEGLNVSLRYGPPEEFYSGDGDPTGFMDVTAQAGARHGDFEWTLGAFIGRSVRSDKTYSPLENDPAIVDDDPYDMGAVSDLKPFVIKGSIGYKTVNLRLMFDGYEAESKDGFGEPTAASYDLRHGGVYAEIDGLFEIAEGLTLAPRLSYKRQEAYFSEFDEDDPAQLEELLEDFIYVQRATQRALAGLTLSWEAFGDANILFGVEGFYDRGDITDGGRTSADPDRFFGHMYVDDEGNSVESIEFFTTAFFAQFLWPNSILNVTVGGRAEVHSVFGAYAAPRLALTKVFDFGLHAKLLASQAFRTPSFLNRSLQDPERPPVDVERTTVFEAELGYQFGPSLSVTANGFLTIVNDPIVYAPNGGEVYRNRDQTASVGTELQIQWRMDYFNGQLAYSYYQRVLDPILEYDVPRTNSLLAAPRHKITSRMNIDPIGWLRITPSLSWLLDRFAYVDDPLQPGRIPNEALLGLAVTARNVGLDRFDVSLIGHDLLGQRESFPQPYSGGHAVLPGRGRQVLLRLSYSVGR